MQDNGIVRGSEQSAQPLIIGVTTVYVHTDIHTVEVENPDGNTHTEWEYREVTYDKDEYIQMMHDEITENRAGIMETYEGSEQNASDIKDLREATIELYEMIGGGE